MAEELDDGEFWLPPKFLSDELMEFENVKSGGEGGFGLTRPNSDRSNASKFFKYSDLEF